MEKTRRKNTSMMPSLRTNLMEMFDIDRFFEDPFIQSPVSTSRFSRVPATNIRETANEYIVEVAAPGMKKKDFKVDIDNNVLEIKVEKEERTEKETESYTRKEYDYNSFYRSFTLPDTIESDKIKAEYDEGVLKVHLPKVAEAKKKKVKEIAVS